MDAKRGIEVIRADDFVEYFLFPSLDQIQGNSTTEKLENFQHSVNDSVQKFTADYIWHKEPFQLVIRTPETSRLFNESNIEGELIFFVCALLLLFVEKKFDDFIIHRNRFSFNIEICLLFWHFR